MSDQQQVPEPTHECPACGFNGFPHQTCPDHKCYLSQPRQYTLSEIQSGRAPDPHGDRPSGTGPKVVKLPGSA